MKKTMFFSLIIAFFCFSHPLYSQQKPQDLKAYIDSSFLNPVVSLKWSWPYMPPYGPVSYNIYKKKGTLYDKIDFIKLPDQTKSEFYIDKEVVTGISYCYYVTANVQEKESEPSDTVEVLVNLPDTRPYLIGRITDSQTGDGISFASVTLIPFNGWHLQNVYTDYQGRFITDVFPGDYFLLAGANGYIPEFYDDVNSITMATKITFPSTGDTNIDWPLNPVHPVAYHYFSGRVTDATANPVAAWIDAFTLNKYTFAAESFNAPTDSMGYFKIRLMKGDSVIIFCKPVNEDMEGKFFDDKKEYAEADRLSVDRDRSDINFKIDPIPVYNNSLSGRVTGNNNNALLANVVLYYLPSPVDSRPHKRTTWTDSSGYYHFESLIPGKYIVFAVPSKSYNPSYFRYDGKQTMQWDEADRIEITESSGISAINFSLMAWNDSGYATINGKITDALGNAVNGAFITVADTCNNMTAYAVSDENGNYILSGISPGNYKVTINKFSFNTVEISVSVDYEKKAAQNANFTIMQLTPTSVTSTKHDKADFNLFQNYPNPFNPSTNIKFSVEGSSFVTLKIYDILGNEIAVLLEESRQPGIYSASWNAGNTASGVYFYKLTAVNTETRTIRTLAKKLMVIR